jgi:hypothetical protein
LGVGADVVVDHTGGPLGGEQQVQPEAPAALRNTDQGMEERRLLGGKGCELVDHHQQPREHWRSAATTGSGEVGGTELAHSMLAPSQLGLQPAQRSFGEATVEVGHHRHDVR